MRSANQRAELERIIALPRAAPVTDKQILDLSREAVQAIPFEGKCKCGNRTCTGKGGRPIPLRLLPDQAAGLASYREGKHQRGGWFSIGVGRGKTALAILIEGEFFQHKPDAKILHLVPPGTVKQLVNQNLPWARNHLTAWIPRVFNLNRTTAKVRNTIVRSGLPGVYIVPYTLLSTKDGQDLLNLIDADMVVADEAHNLIGDSARSDRFWAWVERRKKGKPIGVAMSGTLTTKTPMDYHKLIRWCLGPASPLPRTVVDAVAWSAILRSGAEKPTPEEWAMMSPLVRWAKRFYPGQPLPLGKVEGIRTAYKLRLTSAPGVVQSPEETIPTSLEIESLTTREEPNEILQEAMRQVEDDWLNPDGDILTFGIQKHEALRQLSSGIWIRHFWDETDPDVDKAKYQFELEQEYQVALREFIRAPRFPRPGLDTPALVGTYHATHGQIPGQPELYEAWKASRDAAWEGMPTRKSEVVRLHDYKVQLAVEWARVVKTGGIIWFAHEGIGRWVQEALVSAGIRTLWKGAAQPWGEDDGSEKFFCVASIGAHWEGKNLQHHRNQLLLQWPRPSNQCEQLLGRVHRQGQRADRLVVNTVTATEFDHEQIAATIQDTLYVAQTMGGARKLLIADWNPPPRDYSAEYLKAKGYLREI